MKFQPGSSLLQIYQAYEVFCEIFQLIQRNQEADLYMPAARVLVSPVILAFASQIKLQLIKITNIYTFTVLKCFWHIQSQDIKKLKNIDLLVFLLCLLKMVNHFNLGQRMRKTKKEMNLSVELITPEQKLEEISLLEDHKYNLIPLNKRESKINGWLVEEKITSDENVFGLNSLQSSIIFGKAISSQSKIASILNNNKTTFVSKASSWGQAQRNRSHSFQLSSRINMTDRKRIQSRTTYENYSKTPFDFLKKKSGRNLISKSKVYESQKHLIQGITYPIIQMNNKISNLEKQFNPVMGKIRLLMKNRRRNSTNF